MAYRAILISAEQYGQERLYAQATVAAPGAEAGDQVVLVAAVEPPVIFGAGRAVEAGLVKYAWKSLDDPLPADGVPPGGGPIDEATFAGLRPAQGSPGQGGREKVWMVSLDLPIEAPTPAEAVRRFWGYVRELGPVELPTYVSPAGDELAMQAFVLGEEANLDPEED